MTMQDHRATGHSIEPAATDRKAYQAPKLARSADLARATSQQKEFSPGNEDGQLVCWIARAVYGQGDARWMVFRAWLTDEGPGWLRAAYLRFGPRLGPWIAKRNWARRALRPIMDRVVVTKLRRLSAAIA
jgi:hypothetical protein